MRHHTGAPVTTANEAPVTYARRVRERRSLQDGLGVVGSLQKPVVRRVG